MKISKSKAKELYLLNDHDLDNLNVETRENYMNRNKPIKLYSHDDLKDLAIEKYGNIDNINRIKKQKDHIKDFKAKSKEERKKNLLKYFNDRNYFNENDIISEYPCYLYIEFNETKFLKEVKNKVSYDLPNVYNFAIERIRRRNDLFKILKSKNIIYRPESSIINKYINLESNLNTTINQIEEDNFFWSKTNYGILRKNNYLSLNQKEKEDLKDDILYYYLLTTNAVSFPDCLKEKVENILKTFVFFKEINITQELIDTSNNEYIKFINTIKIRNNIILSNKSKSNLPEFIKQKLINNNFNINISYE